MSQPEPAEPFAAFVCRRPKKPRWPLKLCRGLIISFCGMAKLAKNRLNSTWTPLNNEELNEKSMTDGASDGVKRHHTSVADPLRSIFKERRSLVGKWFEKWNDSQRLLVLEDLLTRCRVKQLEQVATSIARRKPLMHDDFTRNFPRVLSIYVFSFLDPRSLCRCAQVSWQWKNLTELDQIWMRKCLRLGWLLTFTPSPFESGMWKRLYIEKIVAIKNNLPAVDKTINLKELENLALLTKTRDGRSSAASSARLKSASQLNKKPPWKGSDPTPKDTWRNNYLENDDEIEKVNKLRKRGLCGPEADEIHRRARQRVNTGQHSIKRASSLTRTKSVVIAAETTPSREWGGYRPTWATPSKDLLNYSSGEEESDPSAAFRSTSTNLVRKKNGLSSQRSARDPPSADLFPSKPWHTPATEDDLDTQVY